MRRYYKKVPGIKKQGNGLNRYSTPAKLIIPDSRKNIDPSDQTDLRVEVNFGKLNVNYPYKAASSTATQNQKDAAKERLVKLKAAYDDSYNAGRVKASSQIKTPTPVVPLPASKRTAGKRKTLKNRKHGRRRSLKH